ncbi:MAG: glycosyltransferase family 39 protein [Verrucomicrobiia bacterium]
MSDKSNRCVTRTESDSLGATLGRLRLYRSLVLAAYVVVGVLWSVCVPTFEAVDENDHFAYIVFLAREHRLPALVGQQPEAGNQDYQPPAYHAMVACVYRALFENAEVAGLRQRSELARSHKPPMWFEHGEEERFPFSGIARTVHVLRVFSVLVGLVALVFLYQALCVLFPPPSVVPLAGLGWAAFLPGFVFSCARVGNDCLAAAVGAAVLAHALKMTCGESRSRDWAILGAWVGFGILAKLTVLPVAAGAVCVLAWSERKNWRQMLLGLACFSCCVLAVSGWWLIRNFQLYGDPTAMGAFVKLRQQWFCTQPWNSDFIVFLAHGVLNSYWGNFGHLTVPMNHWVYRGANVMMLVCLVVSFWSGWKQWPRWSQGVRRGIWLLIIATVASLAALARFALYRAGAEGRYLLPGYAAHALVVAVAILALGQSFLKHPVRNSRRLCLMTSFVGLVMWISQGPLLKVVNVLVTYWVSWKPRFMTLGFYLEVGHCLYLGLCVSLLAAAVTSGAFWSWQARRARSETTLSAWWRERRFALALGWGAVMLGFNVFCLAKFLLPVYR